MTELLVADIHPLILQYLPFTDILRSYQPTCAQWWEVAATNVTVINLTPQKNGYNRELRHVNHDKFLRILSRRFPNMTHIHFARGHLCSKLPAFQRLLQDNTKLQQISFKDGYHSSSSFWSMEYPLIQSFLQTFPEYKCIDLTKSKGVRATPYYVETLESLNVTHVTFNSNTFDKTGVKTILQKPEKIGNILCYTTT
jgi:hypothetical protein